MRILIACECSGRIRRALRGRGHDAWSNDWKPAEDNDPHHIQGDCMPVVARGGWDLIIMHPDCTALAVSGNGTYGVGKEKADLRDASISWTLKLWELATGVCEYVMLENPVSVIFPYLRDAGARVQYVQPHEYGHPEFKRTGFALHGLPDLVPTDPLDPPEPGTRQHTLWQKVWRMSPGDDRAADRARTYLGIADAIAEQWPRYIIDSRGVEIVGGMHVSGDLFHE